MDDYYNYLRLEPGHQSADDRPTAVHEISSSTDKRKRRRSKLVEKQNGSKAQNAYKKACERPPAIVARRNARERSRVKNVNSIFHRLRLKIPSLKHRAKRVSKLKILKGAIDYIYELQDSLDRNESMPLPKSPIPEKQAHSRESPNHHHAAAEYNKLRYFPINSSIIPSPPPPPPASHGFGREWVYGCACCTDWLVGTHTPSMFESITAAMAIPAPGTEFMTPIPVVTQPNQYFLGTITGSMAVARPSSVPSAYSYHVGI